MNRWSRAASAVLAAFLFVGCASGQSEDAAGNGEPQVSASTQAAHNTLSEAESAEGWELLFDGRSMDGWRAYDHAELPGGWEVADGMIVRTGPGGDLMTDRVFRNFELSLDWRVEERGNSGIFYLAAQGEENIYHSAPEMQVLDDERHPDGQNQLTSAGANYGLHPAPRGIVHPAGEWNHIRIMVLDDRVEHWMNGEKIVDYVIRSPEWVELVAASKFSQWPAYGQADEGHIGLQDHGDPVWYRNIKIRELD